MLLVSCSLSFTRSTSWAANESAFSVAAVASRVLTDIAFSWSLITWRWASSSLYCLATSACRWSLWSVKLVSARSAMTLLFAICSFTSRLARSSRAFSCWPLASAVSVSRCWLSSWPYSSYAVAYCCLNSSMTSCICAVCAVMSSKSNFSCCSRVSTRCYD